MARFLHLSDLHVVPEGRLASGKLDTPALLRRAIDTLLTRMDEIGPIDAVLVTGDVSDDGSDESYRIACDELARLERPVLAVPGNHDRREPFRKAFSQWMDLPTDGPVNWAANQDDTLVIGLDTLIEGQGGGRLAAESLTYLSNALATAKGRQIVIALHHPPIRTGIRFMDAIGLANTDALARVIADCPSPIRILSGHVHGVYHGFVGAHSVVTAPATCSAFALDCRDTAPAGFWTGPVGYAALDTAPGGTWTAQPLDHGNGQFAF